MESTNVTLRMDKELKQEADELFADFGLSFSNAVIMFVKQALREQCIPFKVTRAGMEKYNEETRQAIKDVRERRHLSRPFNTVEELMEDLNADD
ncbi:MAG: type II toxin-antitoxin system RelB/DinJ family antitoxin [Eubacterium sp.]|nr:type II toxin-antitoxin system RelB/DinJ family antitoxin [Eubacterium sp.]MCM1216176.1 type II toxin-antitoxin system RelB/DinJ family antitoxin [Lachnospiraceae bacterium]MCM1239053.1 type II toxin-antitoxin system RelB/DinJ family antitoxin [Lachnospiraceae bacterium]MCM1540882.1 type II toxin-antitoxin system RelB/DinJ family antitoxin [Blautia sp.]